jgi:hypothetical protein
MYNLISSPFSYSYGIYDDYYRPLMGYYRYNYYLSFPFKTYYSYTYTWNSYDYYSLPYSYFYTS